MSNEVDIILAEYNRLREEIITKMEACWKILTFETGGTSIILGFVFSNGQYVLLPIIPFLILISSFIHLGETSAIITAGDYIREHTEKDLQKFRDKSSKSMWWQNFLRGPAMERKGSPYKLIHISTFCLFAGMFWASIALTVLLKGKIEIPLTNDWQFNLLLLGILLGYAVAFFVYLHTWYTHIIKKL
jgi:hypothetical protein